jgi:hypothetical protein
MAAQTFRNDADLDLTAMLARHAAQMTDCDVMAHRIARSAALRAISCLDEVEELDLVRAVLDLVQQVAIEELKSELGALHAADRTAAPCI